MSDDLIAFLKAWHDWATNGAPHREPYSRQFGLCYNSQEHGADVWNELTELFNELGDDCYPFGVDDYLDRLDELTQHECPKRLAWVRERLIEAGELVA